jgi:hypothetical protein
MKRLHKNIYKNIIRTCLFIQFGFLTGIIQNVNTFNSYFLESVKYMFFSTTAINHQFNFFTFPSDKKVNYSYFRSEMYLIGLDGETKLKILPLTQNGTIDYLVNPVNRCRIANMIPVTFRDTLLFEAIAKSQALYFLSKNKSYKAFGLEIFQYECNLKKNHNRLTISPKVDTVFKKIFYIE